MSLPATHDIKTTSPKTPDRAPPDGRGSAWTPRQARIHGGWWPRSRDATAELPAILTEMSSRAGRASRIALQVEAFSNIPYQLTVSGRKVHVA
jgi:hypothetical protein